MAGPPAVGGARREGRVDEVAQAPVVVAVDAEDVAAQLLGQRAGLDAEQLGQLAPGEGRRAAAQEDLARLAVEHHRPDAAWPPASPGRAARPSAGGRRAAQRRVGVVEDRQVELGQQRHGGGTYRVGLVRRGGRRAYGGHGARRPRAPARQPPVPRHDADGRAHPGRRGAAPARRLRGGGPQLPRHRRRLRRRRPPSRRWRRGSRAGATRSWWRPRSASRSPIPAGRASRPSASCAACDASLRRLGIDVIDLYQVHAPDTDVALEDTLAALDGLVRAGKVRALGASNFPAWLLAWAVARPGPRRPLPLRLAAAAVLARRALDRDRDPALLPRRRARGPPVGPARRRLPHRPLRARGRRRPPARASATPRTTSRRRCTAAATEANFRAVDEARAVADELGRERRAGRDRLAAGPAGRHRADPRPAHARAARGPAARRGAGPDRRAGRAARALHGARARLSRAHEHRAERHRRRHRAAAPAPERLQEILQ